VAYIELEPELDACVQTQAKRRYNQLTGELLRENTDNKLVEKLETLQLFLESADFNKLRRESEKHLIEGKKVKFILHMERGKPAYEMEVF